MIRVFIAAALVLMFAAAPARAGWGNGTSFQGLSRNGMHLNANTFNGMRLNGTSYQGVSLNGFTNNGLVRWI